MRKEKAVCLTRRQARIMTLLAVAAVLISYHSHSSSIPELRYGLLGLVPHDVSKSFEYTRCFSFSHCGSNTRRGIAGQAEAEKCKVP